MRHLHLFVLICLASFVFGCAGQAPTPTAPAPTAAPKKSGTIRLYDLVNVDVRDVPMLMALDDLRAQGYTVEPTFLSGSTLILDGAARGEAELAMASSQNTWAAIAKCAPLRTIVQFTAGTAILATPKELNDCRALEGKRVALPSPRGLNVSLLNLYLKEKCGDVKPEFISISESAARQAALFGGQVEASLMPGEEIFKLEEKAPGKFHVLISLAQNYPTIKGDGYVVNRAWAEKNPEVVKDFIRALLTAQRRVVANPQLLYDESAKRLKLEPATIKQIADDYLKAGIWDANGGFSTENLQTTMDFLVMNGLLEKALPIQDVADLSYLNAVLDEMGRK